MELRKMLKPSSRGDGFALVGVMFMLSSLVIITVRESYWAVVPVIFGFILMGIGIRIDDMEKKYKSCTAEIGQYCSKHGCIHRREE